MSISDIAFEDTAWIYLEHPISGERLISKRTNQPARIQVISGDSKEFQRLERVRSQKRQEKTQYRANRAIIDPDLAASFDIDLIAGATKAFETALYTKNTLWRGSGVTLPPEACMRLLSKNTTVPGGPITDASPPSSTSFAIAARSGEPYSWLRSETL